MHGHEMLGTGLGWLALSGSWLAMMTAMMAPVAAPWVLAFGRFDPRNRVRSTRSVASMLSFSAGYLTAWLAYAITAASLQRMLLSLGLLDGRHPWSSLVAGGLLIGAGVYQFAPLKRACLTHCRNPITYFLTRWRSGPTAGFHLGFRHGLFCLGCCWALMLLSLAVGMTHMLWMIAIGASVFMEQVVPFGDRLRIPLGAALIVAGLLRI